MYKILATFLILLFQTPIHLSAERHTSNTGITFTYKMYGRLNGKELIYTIRTADDNNYTGEYYFLNNPKKKFKIKGHRMSSDKWCTTLKLTEVTTYGNKAVWEGDLCHGASHFTFEGTYTSANGTLFDFDFTDYLP